MEKFFLVLVQNGDGIQMKFEVFHTLIKNYGTITLDIIISTQPKRKTDSLFTMIKIKDVITIINLIEKNIPNKFDREKNELIDYFVRSLCMDIKINRKTRSIEKYWVSSWYGL